MLPDQLNIDLHKNNEDVIRDTAEQVIKDFAQFGIDIQLPHSNVFIYDELYKQILPIISDMLKGNDKTLLSVLYRIDVNQSKLKKNSVQNPNVSIDQILTHMILERELQKVLTRKYFSGG